jgi:hypothetical protein
VKYPWYHPTPSPRARNQIQAGSLRNVQQLLQRLVRGVLKNLTYSLLAHTKESYKDKRQRIDETDCEIVSGLPITNVALDDRARHRLC